MKSTLFLIGLSFITLKSNAKTVSDRCEIYVPRIPHVVQVDDWLMTNNLQAPYRLLVTSIPVFEIGEFSFYGKYSGNSFDYHKTYLLNAKGGGFVKTFKRRFAAMVTSTSGHKSKIKKFFEFPRWDI